mgnify:CR=1 FL=1
MPDFLIPWKLVIEKVPLFEYMSRMSLFLAWPFIRKKPISENNLRYALVDYLLSFAVFSAILTYSTSGYNEMGFREALSIVNLPWVFLSIATYAIVSAITYSAFYAGYLKVFESHENIKKTVYFLFLQYARTYSIVVIFILSLYSLFLSTYFMTWFNGFAYPS